MTRIHLCILLFLAPVLQAQETIIPLQGNPRAKAYYQDKPVRQKKAIDADTLELPFIDDFSDSDVRPNPDLWLDNRAYINNEYTLAQVTAGIATLDAYDATGAHYPNASRFPYIADYLTSYPINLDYIPGDDVFLSFFFQAKGLGEMPEKGDSLCLEFYNIGDENWERVWSVPGDTVMEEFSQIMLRINQPRFLQKGFQFRFLNYASQPKNDDFSDLFSNSDHWHLDYIRLDINRSFGDTILRDVAFTKPLSSLLKDYEAMPWTHFEAAYFTQRQATIESEISNHDTLIRNVTKTLKITDLYENFTYSPTPTASDVLPGNTFDFNFAYDYPFDFENGDSALFRIKTILRTDAFDYKPNDTLERIQVLKNYYAYDDGSAEAGYGLRGQGTQNSSAAVAFFSYRSDSLRAVDMYFNQVVDSLNLNYFFYLTVWDDDNGQPGNVIYSQLGQRPVYSPINELVRYELDSAIQVQGPFYVGWTKTVDRMFNIGLDLNRNNSSNNFYNIGSGWLKSSIEGSIMLRPVLSRKPLIASVPDFASPPPHTGTLKIFPNPADEYFQFEYLENSTNRLEIIIMDLGGRMVYKNYHYPGDRVPTAGLKNGMYLLRTGPINSAGDIFTQKIIIQH